MTPVPPSWPTHGWQTTASAPRPRYLGIARWVWFAAWLPMLPTLLFALVAPSFIAPILGVPLPILCLPLMSLVDLSVGRVSRSDATPAAAVVVTTVSGSLFAFFGPLVVSWWQVANGG
jgi:hypothetical protein